MLSSCVHQKDPYYQLVDQMKALKFENTFGYLASLTPQCNATPFSGAKLAVGISIIHYNASEFRPFLCHVYLQVIGVR